MAKSVSSESAGCGRAAELADRRVDAAPHPLLGLPKGEDPRPLRPQDLLQSFGLLPAGNRDAEVEQLLGGEAGVALARLQAAVGLAQLGQEEDVGDDEKRGVDSAGEAHPLGRAKRVVWRRNDEFPQVRFELGEGKLGAGEGDLVGTDLIDPQALSDLDAPGRSGAYTLKLWLSDAEGNVGAPAEAPLSYDCVRSDVPGGQSLSTGIGERLDPSLMVHQGQGQVAGGSLRGAGGGVSGATVCVFSRVVTDGAAEFIGTAITGADGAYKFPVSPGPSREIIARYRGGHREIEAHASVLTQIEPTLGLRKKVVRNKHKAVFLRRHPRPP